jgi:hypothetical protein
MYKTLLLTAAFLGASVFGAAGQSTSPSAGSNANVSAATHCKDKATGQARLKSAANTGSAASGSTTGSTGSMSGSSGSAAGSAGSSPATSGPVAANLPDCP